MLGLEANVVPQVAVLGGLKHNTSSSHTSSPERRKIISKKQTWLSLDMIEFKSGKKFQT